MRVVFHWHRYRSLSPLVLSEVEGHCGATFLAGVTRQRVIQLLRDAGTTVHERSLKFAEVLAADEVFSTGNYGKVLPITRVEKRDLQPGPVYSRARELYWDFAHRG